MASFAAKFIKPEIYPLIAVMGAAGGVLGYACYSNLMKNDTCINKSNPVAFMRDDDYKFFWSSAKYYNDPFGFYTPIERYAKQS